jgi:hypothetical protein
VQGHAIAGKVADKPMYDPSARSQQQRRPIPVRSSSSSTANKGKIEEHTKNRVSHGQIIKSSELEQLRGKLRQFQSPNSN